MHLTKLLILSRNKSCWIISDEFLLAAFSDVIGSMTSILIQPDQIDRENIKKPLLLGALKPLIDAIFGILVFSILSTRVVVDILPFIFYLSEKIERERRDFDDSTTEGDAETIRSSRDPLSKLDPQKL